MGVRVLEVGPTAVHVQAPLEPNLNQHSTAFGGSVAALAMIVGWALVHTRLAAEGRAARTVVQEASIRYHEPITGPFTAVSAPVPDETWERFTSVLARRGRARLQASVSVQADGREAARFSGAFVAVDERGTGR